MSAIDIEALLQGVSEESPCGADLEYDEDYLALAEAAKGKPEQVMGPDNVIPAEEPRWSDVRDKALALLGRTKDLTVALPLTRALLRTDGLGGFADALELTLGLLERYWEGVFPDSPIRRMNTLTALCDNPTLLAPLREVPLVASRGLGIFSLRDIDLAHNPPPAEEGGEVPPSMATIEGAFLDVDLDELQATGEAADRAYAAATALDALLAERAEPGTAPDLQPLSDTLRQIHRVLAENLERRGVGGPEPADEAAEDAGEGGDAAAGGGATRPASGEISSAEDAIRALDKIIRYFEVNEPSSPVPIFLTRAKRLMRKSFIDILRDIAPEAVAQAEHFRGVDSGDDSE